MDMITARNAVESKMNGFETKYNEATAALTKCHQELQAATEARSSKIEEARGLHNAIKREEEKKRIEKEQESRNRLGKRKGSRKSSARKH